MKQYTAQQLSYFDTILLRPLKHGEQFYVADPLTENNTAQEMRELEGKLVTVATSVNFSTGYHRHYSPIYKELNIPVNVYTIKKPILQYDFDYSWLDYHMDIRKTNLLILKTDNKSAFPAAPGLPTI